MILVTGGAGYIGSHCVRELLDRGFGAAVIDNLSTGHCAAVDKRAAFFKGDIRDGDFLNRVFSENSFDAVIHFAASSLVGESVADPLKYYDNNVGGTKNLLEAMARRGVLKIVFSSTAAVYGETGGRELITEGDKTEPTNPYGETKLAIEKMMGWCEKAFGLKSVPLRYFNVAGAAPDGSIGEDHSPETHLIPLVLRAALPGGGPLSIFGDDYPTPDGTCVRDYIHISDLADAHIRALSHLLDGGESEVFNLGNGEGFSVLEIIERAREITGAKIPAHIAPRRPGDPARLVAGAEKARKTLGWEPKYPGVREIIADAWRWHSANPGGFEG